MSDSNARPSLVARVRSSLGALARLRVGARSAVPRERAPLRRQVDEPHEGTDTPILHPPHSGFTDPGVGVRTALVSIASTFARAHARITDVATAHTARARARIAGSTGLSRHTSDMIAGDVADLSPNTIEDARPETNTFVSAGAHAPQNGVHEPTPAHAKLPPTATPVARLGMAGKAVGNIVARFAMRLYAREGAHAHQVPCHPQAHVSTVESTSPTKTHG